MGSKNGRIPANQRGSLKQLRELTGLSRYRLDQLIEKLSPGLVEEMPGGGRKVHDLEATVAELEALMGPATVADSAPSPDDPEPDYDWAFERARLMHWNAEAQKQKVLFERREFIRAAEVKKLLGDLAARIRGRLNSIPAQHAAELAALLEHFEVETALEQIIDEATHDLANMVKHSLELAG